MLYSVKTSEDYIKEDQSKSTYLQMDKIMKKLFTLKKKRPIIDFLNSAYGDNLSYEAVINYNMCGKPISFRCGMDSTLQNLF